MKSFLIFLSLMLVIGSALGQPDGPFLVMHSDSGYFGRLQTIATSNSTLKIFYEFRTLDSRICIYVQDYDLTQQCPVGAPQAIFAEAGWAANTGRAVVDRLGRWYFTMNARETDCDTCRIRTYLFSEIDGILQRQMLNEGLAKGNSLREIILPELECDQLLPLSTGGILIVADKYYQQGQSIISNPFIIYIDHRQLSPQLTYEYFVDHSVTCPITRWGGAVCTEDDRVYLTMIQNRIAEGDVFFATTLPTIGSAPVLDTVGCTFEDRTRGGRLFQISFNEMRGGLPYIRLNEFADDGECAVVIDTTTRIDYGLAAFHPDFGWAALGWTAITDTGISYEYWLARIDTHGVFTGPAEFFFRVAPRTGIARLDRLITDQGKVVMVWTEYQGDGANGWDPTDLIICSMDWNSPLSSDESHVLQPSSFSLSCYPNPFNPSTTISLSLPQAGAVKLAVYDVLGRMVGGHVRAMSLQAGEHRITFDGTDLPSGLYFVRMQASQTEITQKLILMK